MISMWLHGTNKKEVRSKIISYGFLLIALLENPPRAKLNFLQKLLCSHDYIRGGGTYNSHGMNLCRKCMKEQFYFDPT